MRSYPFAAVLFDLDGVVADSAPLHHQVWADFLRAHGLGATAEDVRRADGRRAAEFLAEVFPTPLSAAELERLAAEREALYRQRLSTAELRPVPGLTNFLTGLQALGVPRVLATSAGRPSAEAALHRLGLVEAFNASLTASDVARGKPDPEVYVKAAAAVGVAPQRCLVAEDALAGVRAAKAAGATCLAVTTTAAAEDLRAAGADYISVDFTTLPAELWPAQGRIGYT
jgi:beta-phosphoglucomutase